MPLAFDLPWEELEKYTGINPRPADFEAYWDQALEEMRALDARATWVPADFESPVAECSHLTFHGVGGARVHAKVLRPKNSPGPHPAVLIFHGYSGDSGSWTEKLGYAAAGFVVAAMDCRGQGGLSEDPGGVQGWTLNGHIVRGLSDALQGSPEKLLFRQIFLDTAQLAGIIMNMAEVDASRVGATGRSQGGALTLACAALEPRVRLAAPVYPFLCDYQRVWEMDLARDEYQELEDWFRRFDPQHVRQADVFSNLGYIDVQHLVGRIRAQVLWFIGLKDMICPPSSQMAAYNKIRANKEMRVFPDFGHEDLAGYQDQIFTYMLKLVD